jgi:hypothetical protein
MLSARKGTRPVTTKSLPHAQVTQHGPDDIVDRLHAFCFALPGIENKPSGIAPLGSRALILEDSYAFNPRAFMVGREFAHIHSHPDNGSMHLQLPAEDAVELIAKGWGEDHYLVSIGHLPKGLVLVFSPRNEEELVVLQTIVERSYQYATGHLAR